MAVSTDASYNASSRVIYHRVDIYLDGISATPLSVTRDDYVVTTSLLEEATSGDTPFDTVSSNEFTLSLLNEESIFTPTNPDSPYYGKMKRGVKIIPFLRTSELDDWGQIGEFYVTDWTASPTSSTATVTADDKLYNIFGQDAVTMPVVSDEAVSDLFTAFFTLFDIAPVIDDTITQTLLKAFNEMENKEFLSALSTAFLLSCNYGHDGLIHIRNLRTAQTLRATITDADQVISVDVKLSITSDYDSAFLTYYVPQESAEGSVLSVNEVALVEEDNTLVYALDNTPLIRFKSVSFNNEELLFVLVSATATSKTITIMISGVAHEVVTSLNVRGIYLEKIAYDLGTQEENSLTVDNPYIQDTQSAVDYKAMMDQFTTGVPPIIQATIKGNPNLQIGDKIRLISTRYGIDFTGLLMRQKFDYNGGLSCDITLLNSALIEVAS
jgi:hypothetical protein